MIWNHPLFWVGVVVTGVLFSLILSELPFVFPDRRVKFTMDGFTFNSGRIDKNTGFPRVPEGWYWQVEKADFEYGDGDEVYVRLFDSTGENRSQGLEYIDRGHNISSQLRKRARQVLGYLETEYQRQDLNKFVGNYPPKGLKK